MEVKNYSKIKDFYIKNDSIDFYNFKLKIFDEFSIYIINESTNFFYISLKHFELINIFEYFTREEFDFDPPKISFFNFRAKERIIAFNDLAIKIFKINDNNELMKESLDELKLKGLDLTFFKNKKYTLDKIISLDDKGKLVIIYKEFYSFFQDKYFFKTHIKISNNY